jgi:hypothetical protein
MWEFNAPSVPSMRRQISGQKGFCGYAAYGLFAFAVTPGRIRGLTKKTKDGPQARRLMMVATIYDGATRIEPAKIGGVSLQIIRDWVLRFNVRGPDGCWTGRQPSKLNDRQR